LGGSEGNRISIPGENPDGRRNVVGLNHRLVGGVAAGRIITLLQPMQAHEGHPTICSTDGFIPARLPGDPVRWCGWKARTASDEERRDGSRRKTEHRFHKAMFSIWQIGWQCPGRLQD